MDGLLVLDKPAGPTSHDVVAAVRRLTGQRKIGHTGTLDPSATGVLVLCLGEATKALPFLPEGEKVYQVEARLGQSTETQDATGRVVEDHPECAVTHGELAAALASFLGQSLQLPPMYSAVKQDGQPLYKLARAGRTVERCQRPIAIRAITLDWPTADDRPVLRYGDIFGFTVAGSRGLYVRTICHDLGQRLRCGAHLTALRRLASGPFRLEDAIPLAALTPAAAASRLIAIGEALSHLPAVHLGVEEAARVAHGNPIFVETGEGRGETARAVAPDGRTIAVLARRDGCWQPVRVFNAPPGADIGLRRD